MGVPTCAFPESRCYEGAGLLCLRAFDCSTIPLLPKPGVLSFTCLRVETSFLFVSVKPKDSCRSHQLCLVGEDDSFALKLQCWSAVLWCNTYVLGLSPEPWPCPGCLVPHLNSRARASPDLSIRDADLSIKGIYFVIFCKAKS